MWSSQCNTTFQYIKERLASNPILSQLQWGVPFIPNHLVREHAITYILIHNDVSRRAHVIYYNSKLMLECELRYTKSKKYLVALLYVYMRYKHYLLSNNFLIMVENVHKGLKLVMNQFHPKGRIFMFSPISDNITWYLNGWKGWQAQQPNLLLDL